MKIVVISDIHILGADDPLYRSLLTLMEENWSEGDHLVLAGDIFDFFVGKQPGSISRYRDFFATLQWLDRKGVRTTYIEGNHDFHLEAVFEGYSNVRVVPSECVIEVSGKKIYIAHGDLVDREDRGYLFLRTIFRSSPARFAAWALPETLVDWVGRQAGALSQGTDLFEPSSSGSAKVDPNRIEGLRSKYRGFAHQKFSEGFDAIVLGHCHDFDSSEFREGDRIGRYMNVGYPRVHHHAVLFTPERGLERLPLKRFDH